MPAYYGTTSEIKQNNNLSNDSVNKCEKIDNRDVHKKTQIKYIHIRSQLSLNQY